MKTVEKFSGIACDAVGLQALKVLEDSVALIGIYDENEVLRFSNASFRKAYFIEPHMQIDWTTLMRRNFNARRGTIIETDDIEAWMASVRSRRGKTEMRCYESDLHDGRWIRVVETMQSNGWISYVGTDVTSLNANERSLRYARDVAMRESQTDELTGISNRRHIIGQLEDLTQATGNGTDVSGFACLMDLDHFKWINDTMGHQVGDEVLLKFARCVRETVRLRDGFGRVGGEEFLLVLPGLTQTEAEKTLQRIFDTVRQARFIDSNLDHQVTFSAGLTPVHTSASGAEVYARCDKELYKAKEEGRDRYRCGGG